MEIAFVSSNRIYLEIEKLQLGLTSKVLKKITQNPSRFIASMLLGNNIALVVYGIFMGDRILQLFFPNTLLTGEASLTVVFYQTLISTGVILLTAEFLPKVFFQLYANTFIKIFAIPVAFFYYFFYPLTFLIIELTDYILKKFLNTETDQVQLSFSKIELGNYIEEQLESAQDKENLAMRAKNAVGLLNASNAINIEDFGTKLSRYAGSNMNSLWATIVLGEWFANFEDLG